MSPHFERQTNMAGGPYFLGIDGGTESVRVAVFDSEGMQVGYASHTYALKHPRPGWAEQDPDEWWSSLVAAFRELMSKSSITPGEIAGLSLATTTCTVVVLDKYDRVLRPAIIWMDVRAAEQARRVAKTGDAALKYNGFATVSAEWMPCKALWLKENESGIYRAATHICEFTDWMIHRLTGEWTASINIASLRWYYDRDNGGFPVSLYQAVELDDLLEKFPPQVLDMGTVVGGLSKKAAEELGLPPGIPVAEGGADSMVSTVGLNVLAPGKRTLHTICPALAMKDGKPVMAWNTPGGDNQPQAMLQAFLNMVEFGMNVQQALEQSTVTTMSFRPTMYPHKPGDTVVIPKSLADRVGAALAAKGHKVQVSALQQPYFQQTAAVGAVKMVLIDPRTGVMQGGVSPAKDDYVMGW